VRLSYCPSAESIYFLRLTMLQLDLLHMSFFMSRYVQIKFLICLIQPIQAFRCTSATFCKLAFVYKVIGVHKFGIKTCIWNFCMFHVPESKSCIQKVNFSDWSTLVSLGVWLYVIRMNIILHASKWWNTP
jgi:hypothetical protein